MSQYPTDERWEIGGFQVIVAASKYRDSEYDIAQNTTEIVSNTDGNYTYKCWYD